MKEFTHFRLDPGNQCLWRNANNGRIERVMLTPKAFTILQYLVDHTGRLVTHEEFLDAIWPGSYVQPQVLKSQILKIRKALGDDARKPQYIETAHRRGYRFIAEVLERTPANVPAPDVRVTAGPLLSHEALLERLGSCLRLALGSEWQVALITGESSIGAAKAFYPVLEALGQLFQSSSNDRIVIAVAALRLRCGDPAN